MPSPEPSLPLAAELKIGAKIKNLREKNLYTLQDLAAKTGIPRMILTDIEADEYMPPVATLLKLARALNVGMAFFFQEEGQKNPVSVTRAGDRIRVKRRPHLREGEVDYFYESLEHKMPGKHMEPLWVEFAPLETDQMVFTSHEGEEFLFLLEGSLEFRTDDRVEVLHQGDSLYFDSSLNHSFRSLTFAPARAIVVVWTKI
jgi:transcriptional regulator with XRE-family HTH domain